MTVVPRSFAVGRLRAYRNIFTCLGNGSWYFLRTAFGTGIFSFPSG